MPEPERSPGVGPPFGLPAKLALALVLSTVAFWSIFGYLNLKLEKRQFEQTILLSAERTSDIIRHSTRHEMLRNDRQALRQIVSDIGNEPGIRRVRLFNKEGRISFSSDPTEVNKLVDKRAEQCYACHAQSQPLTKLARPDRDRIFADPTGQRVLAMIRPVENHPDCSNADCHAHPARQRILGVIDTQVSLAGVDQKLADHQRQMIAFTAMMAVLVSLVSVIFIWVVVHRPIRELMTGTRKVADGDLEYRLAVHSNDELGALAESFNKMTADLAQAHAEVTGWARTLEERVERKTLELERAHTSLVANEKMASLGKLAATVAHEVNNPLFGMLTYARLVLKALDKIEVKPELKAEMIEHLRIIERESRRCGDIMRNLLTFARHAPPRPQSCDLNTLVERALRLVNHQAELQGIGIEEDLAAALPKVWCDAGQIQQVVLVLLVNACEAMPQGGLLRVSTQPEASRRAVRLKVADTGMGIPADILPQIFEPFFTTKEEQQRTGLGLAGARSIVEQHAGSIAVDSAPGAGTTFVVTLPEEPEVPPPSVGTAGQESTKHT